MNILFAIALLCVMFLTSLTAPLLGITEVTTNSFMFMVVYMACVIIRYPQTYFKKGAFGVGLLLLAVFGIIMKAVDGQDYFKSYLCFIILPVLMAMTFESNHRARKELMGKLVLLFLFVECGIAIYERLAEVNLLLDASEEELIAAMSAETWEFRSSALLEHPLLNAHVVTIITAFILTSKKGLLLKFLCFLMSYITLFCFNARGATIVYSIVLLPYMYYLIRNQSPRKYRDLFTLLAVAVVAYILYMIFNSDIGGRLANEGKLLDGSAKTRLEVLGFVNLISSDVFLWGSPSAYMSLMEKLRAGGVENGVVVLVIKYGVVMASLMLLMLFRFQTGRMKGYYSKLEKWIVLIVFYVIGVMNPNLSTPTVWVWWVISYYAFRDETRKYELVVQQKNKKRI